MREITVQELQMNPVTAIAQDWMLITAGCGEGNYNTMTASWGQIGHVWGHGKRIGTTVCYVRPQRYTKQFIAMDSLVAQLNQTSGFLMQQLANLPKLRRES